MKRLVSIRLDKEIWNELQNQKKKTKKTLTEIVEDALRNTILKLSPNHNNYISFGRSTDAMKQTKKKKKMKGISNLTYALLTVPIILIVATAIFSSFQANIDRTGWTAEANTTFERVTSGTWSGFNLASMLPFILIAVVIVGVILGAVVFAGR